MKRILPKWTAKIVEAQFRFIGHAWLFYFLLLLASVLYLFLPCMINAWSMTPATGGDTGSHFWPVYAMREYGFPHLTLRIWNPGNMAGEPLLINYFPLPFILMALTSYFMPIGLAFNVGTLAPLVALPFCVFFGIRYLARSLGFNIATARTQAVCCAIFTLGVLCNDGYAMWGGNALSLLAGQFAHMYALCFLFLGMGFISIECMERTRIRWSPLCFFGVVTSHAYVAFFLPLLFLCLLFCLKSNTWVDRLRTLTFSATLAIGLSLWFLVPMIDNAKWTTAFAFSWGFQNFLHEVMPLSLAPVVITLVIVIPLLLLRQDRNPKGPLLVVFWLPSCLIGVYFYTAFVRWGLVDVRAIPQIQYFAACLAGMALGYVVIEKAYLLSCVLVAALAGVQVYYANSIRGTLDSWSKWNYSGWVEKSLFENLFRLSQVLKGDFSQPRVIFEHDANINNSTGSSRVFEMLPLFTGRAVTESLYMQSTILAPMIYNMQAEVSKRPSCPYGSQYGCPSFDLEKAIAHLRLFNVRDLILSSDEVAASAAASGRYKLVADVTPWRLFRTIDESSYVDIPSVAPEVINEEDWKDRFWKWFKDYKEDHPYLVQESQDPDATRRYLRETIGHTPCRANVKVSFNRIDLTTQCPNRLHVLKFSYHGTWRTDQDDKLYLVSPGFIGIVPHSENVVLRFGHSWVWFVSSVLSSLCVAMYFFVAIKKRILRAGR